MKYVVTINKSQEGIPTLVVAKESFFALGPAIDIVQVITGEEAISIWNRLGTRKEEREENNG